MFNKTVIFLAFHYHYKPAQYSVDVFFRSTFRHPFLQHFRCAGVYLCVRKHFLHILSVFIASQNRLTHFSQSVFVMWCPIGIVVQTTKTCVVVVVQVRNYLFSSFFRVNRKCPFPLLLRFFCIIQICTFTATVQKYVVFSACQNAIATTVTCEQEKSKLFVYAYVLGAVS